MVQANEFKFSSLKFCAILLLDSHRPSKDENKGKIVVSYIVFYILTFNLNPIFLLFIN